MRLKDKVAVIIGAGQSPGETLGNGRATVLRFAQEGAKIFAVDRDLDSANETAAMARAEGAECETARADVTRESELKTAIEARLNAHGVASESVGHRYPGVDPNNICNRGARGVGVQIELTTAFRAGNEWQALINATQEALAAFCRPQD